jgi:hypothetical protein
MTSPRIGCVKGAVEAVGEGVGIQVRLAGRGHVIQSVGPGAEPIGCGRGCVVGDARACEGGGEFGEALAGAGAGAHDRAAQVLGEGSAVDVDAALAGQVDHVDRDDGGQAPAECLAHEHEAARRLVASATMQMAEGSATGWPAGGGAALEDGAADLGFDLVELEGVDAGEVDELAPASGHFGEMAHPGFEVVPGKLEVLWRRPERRLKRVVFAVLGLPRSATRWRGSASAPASV